MTGGQTTAETTPFFVGSILDTTNAQIVSLCPSDPDGDGDFRKDRNEDDGDGDGDGDGGGHHGSSSSTTTTTTSSSSTASNTASCSILPSSATASAAGSGRTSTTSAAGAQGTSITGNDGGNISQMHSNGISGGAIAGIIIGLLALIVLSTTFFFILRGRLLRQREEADRLSREEKEVPPIPLEFTEVHDTKADTGQDSCQASSTNSGAEPSRATHPRGALSLSSSSPSSEMSEFQYATLTYSSLHAQRPNYSPEVPESSLGSSLEPSVASPSRVRTPETNSSLHGDMVVHQKALQDHYHSLGREMSSTDAVSASGSRSTAEMENFLVHDIDELPPPEYKE